MSVLKPASISAVVGYEWLNRSIIYEVWKIFEITFLLLNDMELEAKVTLISSVGYR
jgi:hypothetical protein